MTKKISLLLLLCLSLVLLSATNCSAEQMYQISEAQLQTLESNNTLLQEHNNKQRQQLNELSDQVRILQQELASSKVSLKTAQQSLSKIQEYTKQLETLANSPPLMFGAGFVSNGEYVVGLKYKVSKHLETAIVGNNNFITTILFMSL